MSDTNLTKLAALAPNALCLVLRGNQLLLDITGQHAASATAICANHKPIRCMTLGERQGRPCFAMEFGRDTEAPAGQSFVHVKNLLDSHPQPLIELAGRALELLEFERTHQFCGSCGAATQAMELLVARRCSNPACGREHFPRVSPVIIVAVERGEEILLGSSPHFAPGMYSALAGFVDAGESAEQAVHREVFEESGLSISNLRYFASQPWPFPHSLMLGFHADYADGEIICAPDEIEDAQFFHVDRLPVVLPMRATMASLLLQDFCQRHGRSLPASRPADIK